MFVKKYELSLSVFVYHLLCAFAQENDFPFLNANFSDLLRVTLLSNTFISVVVVAN